MVMNEAVQDPSMKVSDTRDSSQLVFPSTGLGGGSGPGTNFLTLQTNFPNMNMEEFEAVSNHKLRFDEVCCHFLFSFLITYFLHYFFQQNLSSPMDNFLMKKKNENKFMSGEAEA